MPFELAHWSIKLSSRGSDQDPYEGLSVHARAIGIGVSLLFALAGCGSDPLPDDLIQVWRNPAQGYSDRYFEVREGSIIFGTGAHSSKMHSIERVRSQRVGETTELTIEYRADDGETVPLNLVHTPGSPPQLRIGSRPDQWIPDTYIGSLKDEKS